MSPDRSSGADGAAAASSDARWAAGFQALDDEMTCDELPVTGTLPDWLGGSLLRVGPVRFEAGRRSVASWFDGLAMLHRFGFEAGRVPYRNRFLRSEAFGASEAGGYLHSFGRSVRYLVLAEFPLRVSPLRLKFSG